MKETVVSALMKILIAVLLVSLFGCTTACPETATTLRERHSQVVLACWR